MVVVLYVFLVLNSFLLIHTVLFGLSAPVVFGQYGMNWWVEEN